MEGSLQGSQQPVLIYSPGLVVCTVPPSAGFLFAGFASVFSLKLSSWGHVKVKPPLSGKLWKLGCAVSAFEPQPRGLLFCRRKADMDWEPAACPAARLCQHWAALWQTVLLLPACCALQGEWRLLRRKAWNFLAASRVYRKAAFGTNLCNTLWLHGTLLSCNAKDLR